MEIKVFEVVYSGPIGSTFSIFHEKKNTLIFFYTCFYVKIIKNNQKFNILKAAKNYKSQISQKFNILKTAKIKNRK